MPRALIELLIHWENWLLPGVWVLVIPMREARVLRNITAWGHVRNAETLATYHFAVSIVEHMIGHFANFHGFVFLF
jgi:hypothetical protein